MAGLLQRLRQHTNTANGDLSLVVKEAAGDSTSLGQAKVDRVPADGEEAAAAMDDSHQAEAEYDFVGLLGALQEEVLTRHPDLIHPAAGDPLHRQRLVTFVESYLVRHDLGLQSGKRTGLAQALVAELTGFGPLEKFLADPDITEIMINGPACIYIERAGRLEPTDTVFRDSEHLMQLVQRIIAPLGRRLDASQPYVDARLPDGSRLHAIIAPVALEGPVVTIRRFATHRLQAADLVGRQALSQEMMTFLQGEIARGANLLVSGGTSSGKTTMLNALSAFIPDGQRIVTIEEAAELTLAQSHVVRLEARPPNAEGRGEITVRALVRNALRMRPDRIIIGEVRGMEAFDLLQAMNTGHRGSMCTIHANGCTDALNRFENTVLMAPEQIPHTVVRRQVRDAVDVVMHLARLNNGRRIVTEIATVAGKTGQRRLQPMFRHEEGKGFVALQTPTPVPKAVAT